MRCNIVFVRVQQVVEDAHAERRGALGARRQRQLAEERRSERQLVRLLGDHHAERREHRLGEVYGLALEPGRGARQLVCGIKGVDLAELVQGVLDLADGRLAVPARLLLGRGRVRRCGKVAAAVGMRAGAAAAAAPPASAVRGVVHRLRKRDAD